MDDDNDFFSSPTDDVEPIILGSDVSPGEGGGNDFGDYAMMPDSAGGQETDDAQYLGDVNEATPSASMDNNNNNNNAPPIVLGGANTDDMLGPAVPNVAPGELTPMQKWNETWQETLKERKDAENERKAQFLAQAEEDLASFLAAREQKRDNKMTKNREDEQAKLEAIEADLENDNAWQRACKLVELSHDSTAQAADVKRMRDVMIYLKNEPAQATALGAM